MTYYVWQNSNSDKDGLGSTGRILPVELRTRVTLYLTAVLDSGSVLLRNHLIHPLRQSVLVQANSAALAKTLSSSVAMDVTYLAEIANYLAGNLSSVSITASSYDVDGVGEVIDSSGEWVGGKVAINDVEKTTDDEYDLDIVNIGRSASLRLQSGGGETALFPSSLDATILLQTKQTSDEDFGIPRLIFKDRNYSSNEIYSYYGQMGLRSSRFTFNSPLGFEALSERFYFGDVLTGASGLVNFVSCDDDKDMLMSVKSCDNSTELRLISPQASKLTFCSDDDDEEAYIDYHVANDLLLFHNEGSGAISFSCGGVGIGTETPQGCLHVVDNTGDTVVRFETNATSGKTFVVLDSENANSEIQFQCNGAYKGAMGYNKSDDYLYWYKGGNVVLKGGNMGIGTLNPAGKLDVNGKIYQRGTQIHADYVFEDDYTLESIEKHAEYMWREKHLPAITKAMVDENGLEVVEVGSHRRGIVEELEKAHIYIQQLKEEIRESKQNTKRELEELKKLINKMIQVPTNMR